VGWLLLWLVYVTLQRGVIFDLDSIVEGMKPKLGFEFYLAAQKSMILSLRSRCGGLFGF
jgi:hypothetical protein